MKIPENILAWQESRAWQWLERHGPPRRVAVAGAISVGAHFVFFLIIALLPEGAAAERENAEQSAQIAQEETMEIVFESSATREKEASEAIALPTSSAPIAQTAETAAPTAPAARGILTQLDPQGLKKVDEAPQDAAFLASHHSAASKGAKGPKGTASQQQPEAEPPPKADEAAAGAIVFRTERQSQADTKAATDDSDGEGEGEGSIAALGGWNKAVANAIGTRWDFYRRSKMDLLGVGSVRIKFSIDAKGRVGDVHVLSNSAGSTNALYAVRATTEAEIPPIPPDRLAKLQGNAPGKRIEVQYTFTIFPNS